MRILIIHHRENIPGTLRPALLARELAELGNEVTVIATSERKRLRVVDKTTDRVKTIEMPDLLWSGLRRGFDPWNTLRRVLFLIGRDFDIIHAFDSRPNVILPGLFCKWSKGVPLILDWADWWGGDGTISKRSGRLFRYTFGWIEIFFEERFRKFADGSTVVSSALGERLRKLGYARRILLSHHGCDVERVKPIEKAIARRRVGLAQDGCFLGYVGNIFPMDARLLFEAVDIVSRRYKLTLLLIGRNMNRLRLEIPEFVRITNEVGYETILDYLASCDVCLLPLKQDVANNGRWPSKVNDYLQLGKPIVSTPISDLKQVFQREHVGLLANDTPQDFADGIVTLLENKRLGEELGKNARRYAEDQLNWKVLARQLNDLYIETLKEKGKT